MIRRFPIAAATLALSLTASASMAAEGNKLSQDDEQLRSALLGAPLIVKLEVASVTLTSSADAMFPSGGWQISSDSPLLNKMLPTFSKLRNTSIVVEGYTDNVQVGPELQAAGISNNLDLSAKRALSVANHLTSHGVRPDLVSALGESHPAASNDTAEGRAKNRRVEITLTGEGCAIRRRLFVAKVEAIGCTGGSVIPLDGRDRDFVYGAAATSARRTLCEALESQFGGFSCRSRLT